MKNNAKKVLCILTALVMLLPVFSTGAFAAEVADLTVDANDLTINNTHTDITNLPYGVTMSKSASTPDASKGGMKAYKLTDVLGLSGGEAAIEFVARESRVNDPQLIYEALDLDITKDFYITMDMYIGEARDLDVFQIGGRYSSDASNGRSDDFRYFSGDGRLVNGYSYASSDSNSKTKGYYDTNNWYRFVLAKVADGGVDLYLDGKAIVESTSTAVDSTNDIHFFGVRLRHLTDITDFSGLPQWFAVKEMKVYENETYVPANSDITASSSVYTVGATSYVYTTTNTIDVSVTNVPESTTVEAFLSNITVPTGANKQVVTINSDDKKTTTEADATIVTSDMKLLVTAQDGGMKLYDIGVNAEGPSISSNATYSAYVVDSGAKTITIPDTTAEKLTSRITVGEGTTVSVVDKYGETVTADTVSPTMKLVAEKNGVKDEYTLIITNNKSIIDTTSSNNALNGASYSLGQTLVSRTYNGSSWTYDAAVTTNGKLLGWGTGTGSSGFLPYTPGGSNNYTATANDNYKITLATMCDGTIRGYKMESNNAAWKYYQSNKTLQNTAPTGDKTIMQFKLKIEAGGAAAIETFHNGIAIIGDLLRFQDNNIYFGGRFGNSAFASVSGSSKGIKTIGTYEEGVEYDVTIVKTSEDYTNGSIPAIEGIYLGDTKIFPTAEVTLNTNGYYEIYEKPAKGIDYINLRAGGTGAVYYGGISLYMADDYNPVKETTVTEEADLTITSSSLTIDAVNNRIYGWEIAKTVADLKGMIDSKLETKLEVLDITGRTVLTPSASVGVNMFVKISDVNYPENAEYYIITKNTEDTQTSLVHDVNNNLMKASRSIRVYNAEPTAMSKTLLYAAYDESGALEAVKSVTHTIQNPGDYNFVIELPYDANWSYKAFFWNMTNLVPYEAAK